MRDINQRAVVLNMYWEYNSWIPEKNSQSKN